MGAIQVARRALCVLPLAVAACSGPRPAIAQIDVRAGPTYQVLVTVVNQGRGSGEAELTARLVDSSTHRTAAQSSRTFDLDAHERVDISLSLEPAQPGAYQTVVQVHYPIE